MSRYIPGSLADNYSLVNIPTHSVEFASLGRCGFQFPLVLRVHYVSLCGVELWTTHNPPVNYAICAMCRSVNDPRDMYYQL
jgi:hypothetical protein